MEIYGLIAIAYLLAPIILIGVLINHHRRIRKLREEISSLDRRIYFLESSGRQAEAVEQAPVAEPAEEPVAAPPPEPEPQPVSTPVETPAVEPSLHQPVAARSVERPVVAEARAAEEEPTAVSPDRIVEFIRKIGMMPPVAEEGVTRETILMQWWIPRIGGFLALLSALFFAVYINQSTSPLFKFVELVMVSVAVGGLGLFLERKYKALGGVLLVTGMIMLYLASVAGYVLPAVRVMENPVIGSLVQTAVLAGICAVGYRRRSTGIVLLAFHFGYFLSLFMAWEGMREGALIASGLLFIAGILLSTNPVFKSLTWVIVPGSFLVPVGYVGMSVFKEMLLPAQISMQVYINLVFAGVGALHYFGRLGEMLPRRILLSMGSSLAILSTGLFFRVFYPASLEWASLALGCVMLAGSLAVWVSRDCRFFVQILFIKASFLIGVWAILHFSGDLRWMVLALETVVLAFSARRSRALAMELAVWAVAFVSLVFFLQGFHNRPELYSIAWWLSLLYPGVMVIAFSMLLKVLPGGGFSIRDVTRNWAYGLVPLIAILIWHPLLFEGQPLPFEKAWPFVVILYGAAGLSFVRFLSRWMLQMTAGLAFVAASLVFWDGPFSLPILASLLLAGSVGIIILGAKEEKAAVIGENAIYPLLLISLTLYVLQLLNNWSGQASVIFVIALAVLFLGLLLRIRHGGSWFFIPVLIFLLTEQPAFGAGDWSLLNLGCGFALLVVPAMLPMVRQSLGWGSRNALWSFIAAGLFWIYIAFYGDPTATWISGQITMGFLALGLLLVSLRYPVPGVFLAGLMVLLTQYSRHSLTLLGPIDYMPWKSEALGSGVFVFAYAIIWLFYNPVKFDLLAPGAVTRYRQWSSAVIGVLLFSGSAITFYYEELGWISWYTPILATTAFGMILLGLFRRDSVLRQLGIAALCLPLVRLFVVDVQDVLHRIIAFAAAAGLLTALGYLYHRLSEKLEED